MRQEKLDAIDQIRNGFLDFIDARVSPSVLMKFEMELPDMMTFR